MSHPGKPILPSLDSTRALARSYRADLNNVTNKGAQRLVVLLNEIERLEARLTAMLHGGDCK